MALFSNTPFTQTLARFQCMTVSSAGKHYIFWATTCTVLLSLDRSARHNEIILQTGKTLSACIAPMINDSTFFSYFSIRKKKIIQNSYMLKEKFCKTIHCYLLLSFSRELIHLFFCCCFFMGKTFTFWWMECLLKRIYFLTLTLKEKEKTLTELPPP